MSTAVDGTAFWMEQGRTKEQKRRSALTSDDSIRRCDGGDDVLHDTLCERPGDTLDLELLRARGSDGVQPSDVLRVIRVKLLVYDVMSVYPG